jgi:hypothetical protein
MDPIPSQMNPDRLVTVHNGMASRLTAVEAKFTRLHLTPITGIGSVNPLTLNIQNGVPRGHQTVFVCDSVITITTDVLLIFVCVRHQLKINIV